MASTRKRKKLPKSVYKRRQRNLILAMIGILLVLILSLVLVIRRHGDAPGCSRHNGGFRSLYEAGQRSCSRAIHPGHGGHRSCKGRDPYA